MKLIRKICCNDCYAKCNIGVLASDGVHGQRPSDFVKVTKLARPLYAPPPIWCGLVKLCEGDRLNNVFV